MAFFSITICVLLCVLSSSLGGPVPIPGFRPPAVPLIINDPYLSIWSMADKLTDEFTKYWDGTIKAFTGIARIDGVPYRFMGPYQDGINTAAAMQQINVTVFPLRTEYCFIQSGINLCVTFMSPLIPKRLDILARPATYITFEVYSVDDKQHSVQIYYDNTAEMVVNTVDEAVVWSRTTVPSLITLRMGSKNQGILGQSGDRVGIDWGYEYVAIPAEDNLRTVIYDSSVTRSQFVSSGTIPATDDTRQPRAASDAWPCIAAVWNLGNVGRASVSRYLIVAYDDLYSIKWFDHNFRPYWKMNPDTTAADLLVSVANDYTNITSTVLAFDKDLLSRLQTAGGDQYATLSSLIFRQTMGGCKLVWNDQKNILWYFMKEISSNGDLQTVDVIFPASPLFLHQNPYLLKKLIIPHLAFAAHDPTIGNCNYNKAWAPHQLGTYPIAYCMGQEDMPVEETANIILMLAKIAQLTGNLDEVFPTYWPLVLSWGEYLTTVLPDPGDQLCTDDFEGPSPHNANLAVKGIVGLGAMSQLCALVGNTTCAGNFKQLAIKNAQQWVQLALDKDSSHYKLAYDNSDTWSLKYNLVYQKFLNLDLFSNSDVIQKELDYYINSKLNKYGIPLDNRATFTKLDWSMWVATLAENNQQFQTIVNRIYNFAHESPSRVPLTDWYQTTTGTVQGFQARTVLGALFSKILLVEDSVSQSIY